VAVVAMVLPLVGTFTSPSYSVPGDLHVHLHHARYTVYQHTGTKSTFGSLKQDLSAIRITGADVLVRAPDGSSVPLRFDTTDETLTRGSDVYSGALSFDAPSGGEYAFTFRNATVTTVVIARSLSDALRSVLVWLLVAVLGGVVLITGVVMLIVGATRRGRAKRAMYPGWGPPPQWGGPPPQWGSGPPPQWGPGPPPPPPGPPPGQWGPPTS
jgi:hypothetical protein